MQNTPSKRYRHLQPEERMTLASLVQQQYTACEIAKVLKCSTSTVTRELKRNAQGAGYSSQAAITCSQRKHPAIPSWCLGGRTGGFDFFELGTKLF